MSVPFDFISPENGDRGDGGIALVRQILIFIAGDLSGPEIPEGINVIGTQLPEPARLVIGRARHRKQGRGPDAGSGGRNDILGPNAGHHHVVVLVNGDRVKPLVRSLVSKYLFRLRCYLQAIDLQILRGFDGRGLETRTADVQQLALKVIGRITLALDPGKCRHDDSVRIFDPGFGLDPAEPDRRPQQELVDGRPCFSRDVCLFRCPSLRNAVHEIAETRLCSVI